MARGPIRKKRDLDRDQITTIATKIFAEKGYHAGTLDDVAKHLDVTRASLYYHVKNKEELLKDICNNFMVAALQSSRAILDRDIPTRDKLREYIRGQVYAAANRRELCIVLFEHSGALNSRTLKKLKGQMREFDQVLIEILNRGVQEGIFKINDVRMASFLILGACFWTYHWYYPGGRLTADQIADEVVTFLENGYLSPESSKNNRAKNKVKPR